MIGVPHDDAKSLRPVLLFLNGVGENGDDGLFQISNNFGQDLWRRRGNLPFLVVCPQCSTGGRWAPDSNDGIAAMEILDQAIAQYYGDPDRVFVTGPSSGGVGALALASAFPERFAGVVSVSTTSPGDPQRLGAARMPIWVFFNSGDSPTMSAEAEMTRQSWLHAGLSPLVSELPGRDHNAWDPAYAPPAIYNWMLRLPPASERCTQPYKLCTPLPASSESAANSMSLASSNNSELHVQIWLDDTSAIEVALISATNSDAATVNNPRFLLELADVGTGECLRAEAQRTLKNGWNDIRLHRSQQRIQVFLNGWLGADLPDRELAESCIWKICSRDSNVVKIQNIRHRVASLQQARPDLPSGIPATESDSNQLADRKTATQRDREYSWRVVRDSRLSDYGGGIAADEYAGKCVIGDRNSVTTMSVRVLLNTIIGESVFNDAPAIARQEFRVFLLNNQMRGNQDAPVWKSKRFVTQHGETPKLRGARSGLDEVLLLAPLLAFATDRVVKFCDWTRTEKTIRSPSQNIAAWSISRTTIGDVEEIWCDQAANNCVVRWIERGVHGVTRQIDFHRSGDKALDQIDGWTALVMHPSGQVLDFQTVTVTRTKAIPHD